MVDSSHLSNLFSEIGIDRDYRDMDFDGLVFDAQGWGDDHRILTTSVQDLKPSLVIEVGSWKGASVLRMFEAARRIGLSTNFICVDTWLGSHVDLWRGEEHRKSLNLRHGYPTMFRQFIFNMIERGAISSIYPLPMTTTAAAAVIHSMGLKADLIYIDAGHDELDVASDIYRYYPLLRSGGMMVGDDYSKNWPGVVTAVNKFVAENGIVLRTEAEKWWLIKE